MQEKRSTFVGASAPIWAICCNECVGDVQQGRVGDMCHLRQENSKSAEMGGTGWVICERNSLGSLRI